MPSSVTIRGAPVTLIDRFQLEAHVAALAGLDGEAARLLHAFAQTVAATAGAIGARQAGDLEHRDGPPSGWYRSHETFPRRRLWTEHGDRRAGDQANNELQHSGKRLRRATLARVQRNGHGDVLTRSVTVMAMAISRCN